MEEWIKDHRVVAFRRVGAYEGERVMAVPADALRELLKTHAIVPREPTEDMLVAGQEEWALGPRGALEDCKEAESIFRAMVSEGEKV